MTGGDIAGHLVVATKCDYSCFESRAASSRVGCGEGGVCKKWFYFPAHLGCLQSARAGSAKATASCPHPLT